MIEKDKNHSLISSTLYVTLLLFAVQIYFFNDTKLCTSQWNLPVNSRITKSVTIKLFEICVVVSRRIDTITQFFTDL